MTIVICDELGTRISADEIEEPEPTVELVGNPFAELPRMEFESRHRVELCFVLPPPMEPVSEFWKPNEGETLLGEIAGIEVTTSKVTDSGKATVLNVMTNSGMVKVWLNNWLIGQLQANNASIGDYLSLTFEGKRTLKNGRAFNAYSLLVTK